MSFWSKTFGGALDIAGWGFGALTGYNPRAEYMNLKYQKQAQKSTARALAIQEEEIARQKKQQQDQQRRENMQLMSAVSGLTNTSYSGVSSPTIDYDKYGDLG